MTMEHTDAIARLDAAAAGPARHGIDCTRGAARSFTSAAPRAARRRRGALIETIDAS